MAKKIDKIDICNGGNTIEITNTRNATPKEIVVKEKTKIREMEVTNEEGNSKIVPVYLTEIVIKKPSSVKLGSIKIKKVIFRILKCRL